MDIIALFVSTDDLVDEQKCAKRIRATLNICSKKLTVDDKVAHTAGGATSRAVIRKWFKRFITSD